MRKLAVLLSGRGSNFEAIRLAVDDGTLGAKIVAVVSNKPDARGLARAREAGLPAFAIDHRRFENRAAHEREVVATLQSAGAEFVALAGYMRLLTSTIIEPFRGRIVNIHPSLLPAFPGVNAQAQALAHGVKVSGCTVHLVDETLDNGPIIVQHAVPVLDDDTEETLSARILVEEHKAYVEALGILFAGGYRVEGRRFIAGSWFSVPGS